MLFNEKKDGGEGDEENEQNEDLIKARGKVLTFSRSDRRGEGVDIEGNSHKEIHSCVTRENCRTSVANSSTHLEKRKLRRERKG